MIYTKNSELREHVLQNIRNTVTKNREGIHLSDCIYCIRKAYFRKMEIAPPASDKTCLLWCTGYAFQAYLFPLDIEATVIVDGISCTPDITRGIEVKSTRLSLAKFDPAEQEAYNRQILGYCKALHVLDYDLVVMFVAGDYKPPFPSLDCWHIEATEEEVENNWNLVKGNADTIRWSLQMGVVPQPTCMDWEWEHCECIDLCQDTLCYRRKYLGKAKGGK
jgi:hypothetical protein